MFHDCLVSEIFKEDEPLSPSQIREPTLVQILVFDLPFYSCTYLNCVFVFASGRTEKELTLLATKLQVEHDACPLRWCFQRVQDGLPKQNREGSWDSGIQGAQHTGSWWPPHIPWPSIFTGMTSFLGQTTFAFLQLNFLFSFTVQQIRPLGLPSACSPLEQHQPALFPLLLL